MSRQGCGQWSLLSTDFSFSTHLNSLEHMILVYRSTAYYSFFIIIIIIIQWILFSI